jgi:hypothetical protein
MTYPENLMLSGKIQVVEKKAVKSLLSEGLTNAKTAKNETKTYILNLAPFNLNSFGISVCPNASEGCIASCLFSAGRGAFSNVYQSRIRKTDFYLSDKVGFCTMLWNELSDISRKAVKGNYNVAIRLNGTSDLDFFGIVKNRIGKDLFSLTNLVFYDYTKLNGKVLKYQEQRNSGQYYLTFSRSENNWADCLTALNMGVNVAVVFGSDALKPNTFEGFPVVDGDLSDIVMMETKGSILALRAKGKAKKDRTGFVVW